MSDAEVPSCGARDPFTGSIGLRVGAIFILWTSATAATLFPVITKRIPRCHINPEAFDFAKYFGSGVIIATAFIHLLTPAYEQLSAPCLNSTFTEGYSFAPAFAMISMFMTFLVELIAYRIGTAKAESLAYDPHHQTDNHQHVAETHMEVHAHGPEAHAGISKDVDSLTPSDIEKADEKLPISAQASEILGVMILEFGVIFHSVIIGITLGTTNDFDILFIVIIFHQMFEGIGLGARLAYLPLKLGSWIPTIGAIAYGLVTPIGLAIGLGVRHSYNEESAMANYVTGTFDAVSAGILLYTGLVELLSHEFIFNDKMRKAPLWKVLVSVGEMFLGAGLMALLGRWA